MGRELGPSWAGAHCGVTRSRSRTRGASEPPSIAVLPFSSPSPRQHHRQGHYQTWILNPSVNSTYHSKIYLTLMLGCRDAVLSAQIKQQTAELRANATIFIHHRCFTNAVFAPFPFHRVAVEIIAADCQYLGKVRVYLLDIKKLTLRGSSRS